MKNRPLLLLLAAIAAAALAPAALAFETAWLTTTDYSSFGRIRGFAGAAPWSATADLATVPGDAVGRHHDGLVYVVGRGGSNVVQIYDPAAGFGLVREFSLGAGRNLQDIAFDTAGEAYVSCYDQAVLLRVDPSTGAITGTYSTAAYADADGLPETAWMTAIGDRLYITAQKLDRNNWYSPVGPGALLVFDMATESFVAPISLVGADPYTQIEQVADGSGGVELRVGCVGFYGLNDGGIEAVDPDLGTSLGYLATEAQLGGDVTAFASTGPTIHVIISDVSFVTSVRRWDLLTAQAANVVTGTGYVYADVAWDGGFQLYVCDRTPGAAGLRVFDTISGAELTGGVLATGLPPFMIVLPQADTAAPVPGLPIAGSLALSRPFPNPCNPRADLTLSGPAGAAVTVAVVDLRGRRVGEREVLLGTDGTAAWTFDGFDGQGRRLPSGVYRVVARGADGYAARSLTLVK